MNKPAPLSSAVSAIIIGMVVLIGTLFFRSIEAITTDTFHSFLFIGAMCLVVGTICLRPTTNQNK